MLKQKPLKVVFMGCPDFAIPSLSALALDPSFEVQAVYTMPDRPKGRGKALAATPVKKLAVEQGIGVHTPASFRRYPEEIALLKSYKPDYLVVVAYGLILPQEVLNIPKIAAINLHASLLPKYRGPSPIHFAIMNGETETGNTIMLMNAAMDEGDILSTSKTAITSTDDLASIHDRLSIQGAELLLHTLKSYAKGEITATPQNHTQASYTTKISPETAHINWRNSACSIKNLISAMSPCPGAWFTDGEERIKVFKAEITDTTSTEAKGAIIAQDQKAGIQIVCGDSKVLALLELQRAGKNRICCTEFVCGCRLTLDNLCDSIEQDEL